MSIEEVNVIADEKEATFRDFVKDNIQALPGVVELIKALGKANMNWQLFPLHRKENIELISKTLGINKYFSLFINGDDVKEGKPSPQGFLLGAQKLGCGVQELCGDGGCSGGGTGSQARRHVLHCSGQHLPKGRHFGGGCGGGQPGRN